MNRKTRLLRNFGETAVQTDPRFHEPVFDGPPQAEVRGGTVMPERLVRFVLLSEVERLQQNEDELRRFFAHFFDPNTSAEERETYVTDFLRNPPRVTMGYPRATGTWPSFSIVLTSDDESEAPVGGYIGETLAGENAPGKEDQYYEGAIFDQALSIYILAEHPDQCIYLYNLAKLILLGSKSALTGAGLIEPHYSGGEVNPNEVMLPDIAFARVLMIHYKVNQTVPKLFGFRDGRNLRLTGVFQDDVVVDGMRGGVKATAEDSDDGEQG